MSETINLKKYQSFVDTVSFVKKRGRVNRVTGLIIEGDGPPVSLGSLCTIVSNQRDKQVDAEVVGFRDHKILLMPLGEMTGIEPGSIIESKDESPLLNVGNGLLGRILDGNGNPLDNKGPIPLGVDYPIFGTPANPLEKNRVREPLDVGIRAINALLTCGKGQRMGIMAGTGIGKSILLGMAARNTSADVNVVALIGERGREVREFIEDNLGEAGLKKIGRGGRGFGSTAAGTAPGSVHCPHDCRVFPRPKQGRFADDGFGNPFCPGSEGNRIVRRGTSDHTRIHAFCILPPPETDGAIRNLFRQGNDYWTLHRSGGRRRLNRTYFRFGTGHSGRPYRVVTTSVFAQPLPGNRHFGKHQPVDDRRGLKGTNQSGGTVQGYPCHLSRSGGLDQYRRLCAGKQPKD